MNIYICTYKYMLDIKIVQQQTENKSTFKYNYRK